MKSQTAEAVPVGSRQYLRVPECPLEHSVDPLSVGATGPQAWPGLPVRWSSHPVQSTGVGLQDRHPGVATQGASAPCPPLSSSALLVLSSCVVRCSCELAYRPPRCCATYQLVSELDLRSSVLIGGVILQRLAVLGFATAPYCCGRCL